MKPKKRFSRRRDLAAYNPVQLPDILPPEDDRHLVHVFVEGYEDVAFWRGTELAWMLDIKINSLRAYTNRAKQIIGRKLGFHI